MEMGPEEFKDFMDAQTDAIEVAKWLWGEKIGRDPGDEFVIKWIKENAEDFRKNWPANYEKWKKKKQSLH